jgi:hypothetical protein
VSGNIRSGRSALGAFLLVVACGGTIAPQYGIEAACVRLHTTYTQNMVRCFGTSADLPPQADFVASCVGLATAKGSLVQPADLDACTDSIHDCPSRRPAACLGSGSALLFPAHDKRGSLPDGATCLAGLQCASGVCNNVPYTASCGVCVVPKAYGEVCNDDARDVCEDPTFCDGKRCRYSGGEAGESCTTYGRGSCADPFYCSANDPSGTNLDRVCRPRGTAGAACTAQVPCLDALACIAGACRAPLPEGAPCDATRDWCAKEDRQGTCVGGICVFPRTGVQEGGACDPDACRGDLICQSHVCTSLAKLGAPCDERTLCVREAQCGPDGRCVQRPGPGAPCLWSNQCPAGQTCVGFHADGGNDLGICNARGGVGAPCPCSDALTCIAGTCVAWSDSICR